MLHHYVVSLNKQHIIDLSVVGQCSFRSRVLYLELLFYLELHYAQVLLEAASEEDGKE